MSSYIKIFLVLTIVLIPCMGTLLKNACRLLCDDTPSVRTKWPVKVVEFKSASLTDILKKKGFLDVFKFADRDFEFCPVQPKDRRILKIYLCKQFDILPAQQQVRTGCNNYDLRSINVGLLDFLTSIHSHLLYLGECRPPNADSNSSSSSSSSSESKSDRNRSRDRSRSNESRSRDRSSDESRDRSDRDSSDESRRSRSRNRSSNESKSRRGSSNESDRKIKLLY